MPNHASVTLANNNNSENEPVLQNKCVHGTRGHFVLLKDTQGCSLVGLPPHSSLHEQPTISYAIFR